MNIVRKPVAFNLDDPDQKELYDHAMKRTNFSAYVKRLIQRDMEGWSAHHNISVATASHDFDASEFI